MGAPATHTGNMSFTRTAARADAGRVGAGRCCGVRGVCGALLGRSGGGRCDGVSADARRAGDRGGAEGFSMSRSPRGDADCCSRDGGPGLCGARKLSASSARRMPSSSIGTAATVGRFAPRAYSPTRRATGRMRSQPMALIRHPRHRTGGLPTHTDAQKIHRGPRARGSGEFARLCV